MPQLGTKALEFDKDNKLWKFIPPLLYFRQNHELLSCCTPCQCDHDTRVKIGKFVLNLSLSMSIGKQMMVL